MEVTSSGSLTRGLIITAIVLIVLANTHVQGLRGCSNFGHSCFGAHGKRTGNEALEASDSGRYDGLDSLSMAKEMAAEDTRNARLPVNFLRILRNMMRNLESTGPVSDEAPPPSERI